MAKEKELKNEAFFENIDLDELAARVKGILDVRDRQYGFPPKTYPKCFVGSEAVKKLIDENIAAHEEDAVRIGNMMLNAGVFHHVRDAHPFENKKLFYRFLADEDHGSVAHKPKGRYNLVVIGAGTVSELNTMPITSQWRAGTEILK